MRWFNIEQILIERFPPDVKRLTENHIVKWLFGMARDVPHNGLICEIGTLYGSLTAAMALACDGTNKRVFTIDHMIGGHCMDMSLREPCIYLDFVDSMIALNVWDKIVPFPMKSLGESWEIQAHRMISLMDVKFDLIYIDGDHSFANVRSELVAYSGFVKPGGIICGDDCNVHGAPFLDSFLNHQENFEGGERPAPLPAVAKAVLEYFNGRRDQFEPIEVPINQFGFRRL